MRGQKTSNVYMNVSIAVSAEVKQCGSDIGRTSNYCTIDKIVKMIYIIKRILRSS
jgi:hypothetical protein